MNTEPNTLIVFFLGGALLILMLVVAAYPWRRRSSDQTNDQASIQTPIKPADQSREITMCAVRESVRKTARANRPIATISTPEIASPHTDETP